MIRYALTCDDAHRFEGWFSTSVDFDQQVETGLLTCPVCHSSSISKLLMAPSVSTARQKEETKAVVMETVRKEAINKIREVVAEIKANAEDVGTQFSEEARKIHYGEAEARTIIGQTTLPEARELLEEGIEIAPLPVLPDETN